MMVKNAIVLLDTVKEEMDEGKTRYEAIVRAGATRLRPVALAAATTTVLALVTLAPDVSGRPWITRLCSAWHLEHS